MVNNSDEQDKMATLFWLGMKKDGEGKGNNYMNCHLILFSESSFLVECFFLFVGYSNQYKNDNGQLHASLDKR